MLVVSYNPGYQNLLKGMKPSTRQRFVALRFDYPTPDAEAGIIVREAGVAPELAQRLVQLGTALRRLGRQELEEVCSTRLLVLAARLLNAGVAPVTPVGPLWPNRCRMTKPRWQR